MLKNRILLLAAFVLSLILIGFRGGAAAYLLYYTVLLIPVISAVYLFYVYFRFRIYQYIDHKTIVKGEEVPYQFILANEDLITFTYVKVFFLQETSAVEAAGLADCRHLLPGESVRQETSVTCFYRGMYQAGIDKVEVRDCFGLFRLIYPIATHINVKVLPRILHLKEFLPVSEPIREFTAPWQPAGRPAVLDTEIRPYQPGDSMRQIHWKATAAMQKPFSRTFRDEPKSGLLFVCDFSKGSGNELECLISEDKLIETAVAAADYLLTASLETTFVFDMGGVRFVNLKSRQDFDYIYQCCSDTAFDAAAPAPQLVRAACSRLLLEGTAHLRILVLTGELSDALCAALCQAADEGHETSLLCIGRGEQKDYQDRLDGRITLYLIHPEQNIEEVLCI